MPDPNFLRMLLGGQEPPHSATALDIHLAQITCLHQSMAALIAAAKTNPRLAPQLFSECSTLALETARHFDLAAKQADATRTHDPETAWAESRG